MKLTIDILEDRISAAMAAISGLKNLPTNVKCTPQYEQYLKKLDISDGLK